MSDMAGEKLNGVHVVRAAEEVLARYKFLPEFWMVAPDQDGPAPRYAFYIQSKSAVPDGLVSALDAALGENFHYPLRAAPGPTRPVEAVCNRSRVSP